MPTCRERKLGYNPRMPAIERINYWRVIEETWVTGPIVWRSESQADEIRNDDTKFRSKPVWTSAFLIRHEIGNQEASKYFLLAGVVDSCSHFAGLPPHISHAPSTPRLFKPPQEPEIGARPLMTPTAIMATIVIRMTKDKRNSVMYLPIQGLLGLLLNKSFSVT